MWGIVVLMLACMSGGALAQSRHTVLGRLSWCSTLCLCETETNTEVQCFEEDEMYQMLGFSDKHVGIIRQQDWSLEDNVEWCSELCLCNIQSGKEFKCVRPETLVQVIINKIGNAYFLKPEDEGVIKQEAERSVDENEDPSLDQETEHRKRSERRRNRKNRKQKKNQRSKHRLHSEDSEPESEPEPEPEPQPEPQPEPEADIYIPSVFVTPASPIHEHVTSPPMPWYNRDDVEIIEVGEGHEPLPRHEAVAASPAVTALQSPTRKLQPHSTAESHTPLNSARDTEGLSPRVQPVMEVPLQKKTMASMVSQDLDDLGTTVRNIKNDVMLNQRILLVTVAIAGVAMLGVLILAVLSCTSRRHSQAANAKRDSGKDGSHSPKVNLEEAW